MMYLGAELMIEQCLMHNGLENFKSYSASNSHAPPMIFHFHFFPLQLQTTDGSISQPIHPTLVIDGMTDSPDIVR